MRMLPEFTPLKLRERATRTVLAALSILAAAACASVDTAVVAQPGVDFTLAVGQTATLSGTDYRITFNKVTEDSRCPMDVVCVWAGDAKIELRISRSAAPADIRAASLTPPNSEVTSGSLKIRFVSLAPAPKSTDQPGSRKYVAHLVVLSP